MNTSKNEFALAGWMAIDAAGNIVLAMLFLKPDADQVSPDFV